jgi:hypothetical protein
VVISPNGEGGTQLEERNQDITAFLTEMFTQIVPGGQEYRYKVSICLAEMLMSDDRLAGIIYPTIAMFANADNVALKPAFVDAGLHFECADCLLITGARPRILNSQKLAICRNADEAGALKWEGYGALWTASSGTVRYLLLSSADVSRLNPSTLLLQAGKSAVSFC